MQHPKYIIINLYSLGCGIRCSLLILPLLVFGCLRIRTNLLTIFVLVLDFSLSSFHKKIKISLIEHSASYRHYLCWLFQLRVIRAFKSTLEDLEERRSLASMHSQRSGTRLGGQTTPAGPRPLLDMTYIDEEGFRRAPHETSI